MIARAPSMVSSNRASGVTAMRAATRPPLAAMLHGHRRIAHVVAQLELRREPRRDLVHGDGATSARDAHGALRRGRARQHANPHERGGGEGGEDEVTTQIVRARGPSIVRGP